MLGGKGLSNATRLALLNANYIAYRLKDLYTIRYKNGMGRVAHELLIDLGEFEKSAGLKVPDFAKRLQVWINFFLFKNNPFQFSYLFGQDYGFHPPTCSWPISTAILIEPTESETKEELDRYMWLYSYDI